MADSSSTESPLEAAAGAAGPHVTDAFELLSDETRLAILLALWEAHEPFGGGTPVPFSELYDRVQLGDSGNFTYHLDKLAGHFVEKADDGYRLRNAGLKLVQTVIAGAGLGERSLPSTEIDASCSRCGAPVEINYEGEELHHSCSECEGNFGPGFDEEIPPGTLTVWGLNPAGLVDRTPGQIYAAGHIDSRVSIASFVRGVCPECSGSIDESVQICDAHEVDQRDVCPSCGTQDEVRVRYGCSVCKNSMSTPVVAAVSDHPVVNGFYFEQGIDYVEDVDDPESCAQVIHHHRQWEHSLESDEPVRIHIAVPGTDAVLNLTLDGDLDVIDVTEETRETD